jgi:hypothetical protein
VCHEICIENAKSQLKITLTLESLDQRIKKLEERFDQRAKKIEDLLFAVD